MGDVGHKAPLHLQGLSDLLVGRLQFRKHSVEGFGQAANLVVRAGVLHPPGKVALGADGLGRLGQTMDGPQRYPSQHPAQPKCDSNGDKAGDNEVHAQGADRLVARGDRTPHL